MDAATIEEMNRMRVSLGMKPLPVPGAAAPTKPASNGSDSEDEPASTVDTRQAQAYDNYNKVMEAEAAKKKRDERNAAIKKAREQAQRHAKLEGQGLGEEEAVDIDAKSWLLGQKKRQKKLDKTRKLEEELAAAEAEAAAAVKYTSKDLAGIKVAHDTSMFLDGDEQVLTLKDTNIGDEEDGDELENLNLREQEKLNERLDLKKKRPGYNPNDDEDSDAGILAQYDEEINGQKSKRFTLDADGMNAELADILDQPTEKARKLQNVSLEDIVGDGPISSDYLSSSEIKVKKPKKTKKNKGTRQKQADEDDIFPSETTPADNNTMDIDSVPSKKRKVSDDIFVDDEDLQASLAIQRKIALKKRKKTRPEDIAKLLKGQDYEHDESVSQEVGLVIGEISEFVSGLSKPDDDEHKPRRQRQTTQSPEPDDDQAMKDAHEEEDHPLEREAPLDNGEETHIEEEKTVGGGMGAALALLRERGLVEETRGEDYYEGQRKRQEFLSKKRLLEEELDDHARQQREQDRTSGKLDKMSTRDREEWARQQNTRRDHQQSRRMAELYTNGYKPNVELKYIDEDGRALNQKEAFKHLSHQFHGKGSGKGKTEKRLKKVDDEKRREAQSMFDASSNGGMSVATAQQLKKRKEAGVRLG